MLLTTASVATVGEDDIGSFGTLEENLTHLCYIPGWGNDKLVLNPGYLARPVLPGLVGITARCSCVLLLT